MPRIHARESTKSACTIGLSKKTCVKFLLMFCHFNHPTPHVTLLTSYLLQSFIVFDKGYFFVSLTTPFQEMITVISMYWFLSVCDLFAPVFPSFVVSVCVFVHLWSPLVVAASLSFVTNCVCLPVSCLLNLRPSTMKGAFHFVVQLTTSYG